MADQPSSVFGGSSPRNSSAFGAPLPSSPQKRRLLGLKLRIYGAIGLLSVLLLGLVAAVMSAQTNFDLRNFAWGGVISNLGILPQRSVDLRSLGKVEDSLLKQSFDDLSQTYWQADVVNFSFEEFQVSGVAFKHYDSELDKSFIFARIENIPIIPELIPKVWLERQTGEFIDAGVGEIVAENDSAVAYYAVSLEGSMDEYKILHFSYDSSLKGLGPESTFISVAFDEEKQP